MFDRRLRLNGRRLEETPFLRPYKPMIKASVFHFVVALCCKLELADK